MSDDFRMGRVDGWNANPAEVERRNLANAKLSRSLYWLVDPTSRTPVWLQLAWLWCKRLVGR